MNTLRHRIDSGWEISRALCTPLARRSAGVGSKEERQARRARNTLAGRVLNLEVRLDILSGELERLTGLLGALTARSGLDLKEYAIMKEDGLEKMEDEEEVFF